MNIAVWGLGQVGLVTVGHFITSTRATIIGIDANYERLNSLKDPRLAVENPRLASILSTALSDGRLLLSDASALIPRPYSAHFLCVDTKTSAGGQQDLSSIDNACKTIASSLGMNNGTLIVVRSTVLPGSTDKYIVPLLETLSGDREGRTFHVLVNPSFIRDYEFEEDLRYTQRIVIGSCSDAITRDLTELYQCDPVAVFTTDRVGAELIKYVDNAFHALKVTFANEVAELAKRVGTDEARVMDVLCADSRLNISKAYLRPGASYGRRCLPKDVQALEHWIRLQQIDLPLLLAIDRSNEFHAERYQKAGRGEVCKKGA